MDLVPSYSFFVQSKPHFFPPPRRVNLPSGKEGKITKPRQLHASQWGVICPAETPEGEETLIIAPFIFLSSISFYICVFPSLALWRCSLALHTV